MGGGGIKPRVFIAVSFPTLSRKVHIPGIIFFIGKHFGTGVILATAFIHLLDDAFRSLQSKTVEERYGKMGHRTGLIMCVITTPGFPDMKLTFFSRSVLPRYYLFSLSNVSSHIYLQDIFLKLTDIDISTSYVEHLHDKPSAPPTPVDSLPPSPPTSPKPSASTVRPRSSSRSIPRAYSPQKYAVPCSETTPLLLATKPASEPPTLDLFRRAAQPLISDPSACHGHHADHGSAPVIVAAAVTGLPIEVLTNSPRICRLTVAHDHHSQQHTTHHHPHENINVETGEVQHDKKHHPRIGRRRQVISILVRFSRGVFLVFQERLMCGSSQVLQLGIMIHSLVIGLTLSVASGSEFS